MRATLREIAAASLALILKMLIPSKIRTQADKKKQFEFTNLRIYEFIFTEDKNMANHFSFFCFSCELSNFDGQQWQFIIEGSSKVPYMPLYSRTEHYSSLNHFILRLKWKYQHRDFFQSRMAWLGLDSNGEGKIINHFCCLLKEFGTYAS